MDATLEKAAAELQQKLDEARMQNIQEGAKEIDEILKRRGLAIRVRMEWTEGQPPIFHKEITTEQK